MGLNSNDPDKEDEPASHIGTCFITDRFGLRFLHHMYNTDQCRNDRKNEKAQEGMKARGGAETETDPRLVGDKVPSRMAGTCFFIQADLDKSVGI